MAASGSGSASEDLIRQAWSELGRDPAGDRPDDESASESMATAASESAASSGSAPVVAAEEIARELTAAREPLPTATERSRSQQPPPPRPRRTATRTPAPPPPPAPSPRPRATQPAPPRGQRRSVRGMGWLIFAAVWALISIVGNVVDSFSDSTDGPPATQVTLAPTTTIPGATAANISDLDVGECIVGPRFGHIVESVAVVPCDEPHLYELFAQVELEAEPATYPGPEVVLAAARDACAAEFFDYVGESVGESVWQITFVAPQAAEWNDAGDRSVICLLYLSGTGGPQMFEGSAEGRGGVSS